MDLGNLVFRFQKFPKAKGLSCENKNDILCIPFRRAWRNLKLASKYWRQTELLIKATGQAAKSISQ